MNNLNNLNNDNFYHFAEGLSAVLEEIDDSKHNISPATSLAASPANSPRAPQPNIEQIEEIAEKIKTFSNSSTIRVEKYLKYPSVRLQKKINYVEKSLRRVFIFPDIFFKEKTKISEKECTLLALVNDFQDVLNPKLKRHFHMCFAKNDAYLNFCVERILKNHLYFLREYKRIYIVPLKNVWKDEIARKLNTLSSRITEIFEGDDDMCDELDQALNRLNDLKAAELAKEFFNKAIALALTDAKAIPKTYALVEDIYLQTLKNAVAEIDPNANNTAHAIILPTYYEEVQAIEKVYASSKDLYLTKLKNAFEKMDHKNRNLDHPKIMAILKNEITTIENV